jgi:hypothetical protein
VQKRLLRDLLQCIVCAAVAGCYAKRSAPFCSSGQRPDPKSSIVFESKLSYTHRTSKRAESIALLLEGLAAEAMHSEVPCKSQSATARRQSLNRDLKDKYCVWDWTYGHQDV